ncbi:MAG: hypothetical protein Q4C60_06275 [Eubacteriales bacterium]|nr:hypothetical protein [Eubacteriales bacterium]
MNEVQNKVTGEYNIYDAAKDPQFAGGYIDIDEERVRRLADGTQLPFRYLHGGFEGTAVRFSFCFPPKEKYEGRFYQYLSPFPGPEEELASLPMTGENDKIAFCITHGAYYVESNMGSGAAFTNTDDNTMTHRASAATAEFSRKMAREIYGYEHRPYGYVYGGSGGGYRTTACIENTNAFDGAVPYVIGSPYAIPNCQSTRAHAERLLRHKMDQVIDAVDAGGSGDPYEGLNAQEAEALREAVSFGYPMRSWFASADLDDGALPVLYPGVKAMDPTYFTDFWEKEGYLGADPQGSAVRDRICLDSGIKLVFVPGKKEQLLEGRIDTRNGVNDAWKKMITADDADGEPWIELEDAPQGDDLYVRGTFLTFTGGAAQGRRLQVGRIEENRLYITEGFGMDNTLETMSLLAQGDPVHLDNSDYIAIQTYHRHQVPSRDYLAWDQFRNADGEPLYPQRPMLLGPNFCTNGPGCKQNGEIQGKIIIVACLMDEQAYPWQADWYRRKVASAHGGDGTQVCRLWYMDHTLHGDRAEEEIAPLHATTYLAGLHQALVDLAAWVEQGKEPLPSSRYDVDGGLIRVGESAAERGGIQPVVHLLADGMECARIQAGETVSFLAQGEVPEGAGVLTQIEWSFEGETDFPVKGAWELTEGGQKGTTAASHTYHAPGTYFAVARIRSERNGDADTPFTQVRNLARVRVVVE